ncbi:MAG: ribosome maturation factor RimM [Flavobacteriaceae bacterium]
MKEGARPLIHVATIGQAHGVRGAVTVRSFLENPADLKRYNPLKGEDGRQFVLRLTSERKPGVFVAEVDGIVDRDAAEALRNRRLFIPRDLLPAPEDDEFYHADLVGLAARDVSGAALGKVIAVQDFGAGELLEVETGVRRTILIPFTRAAVPEIRPDQGFLIVDPPPGLLDEDAAETSDVEG